MEGKKPVEEMTFEEAFTEMEAVVAALESNQRPLEEAMALFERGQALAQRCMVLLDQAELKVRHLSSADLAEAEEEE